MDKSGLWLEEDDPTLSSEERNETCGPDPIMMSDDIPEYRLIRIRYQNKLKCYNVLDLAMYILSRWSQNALPVELHTQIEFSPYQIRTIFRKAAQSVADHPVNYNEESITAQMVAEIQDRVRNGNFDPPPAEADMEVDDDKEEEDESYPEPFAQFDSFQWIERNHRQLRNIRRALQRRFGDNIGDVALEDFAREFFYEVISHYHERPELDLSQFDRNVAEFLQHEMKTLQDASARVEQNVSFWDMYDVYYGTRTLFFAQWYLDHRASECIDVLQEVVRKIQTHHYALTLARVCEMSAFQRFLKLAMPGCNWVRTVESLCANVEFDRFVTVTGGCWIGQEFPSPREMRNL